MELLYLAPLLGSWSGTSPGTVTANSGAMTLRFTSDGSVNQQVGKQPGQQPVEAVVRCNCSPGSNVEQHGRATIKGFSVFPNPNSGEFTVESYSKYDANGNYEFNRKSDIEKCHAKQ